MWTRVSLIRQTSSSHVPHAAWSKHFLRATELGAASLSETALLSDILFWWHERFSMFCNIHPTTGLIGWHEQLLTFSTVLHQGALCKWLEPNAVVLARWIYVRALVSYSNEIYRINCKHCIGWMEDREQKNYFCTSVPGQQRFTRDALFKCRH